MTNSKKKGNLWENRLANWLRDNGIKAWKDGSSGGGNREKGDVGNNIDMTMESKAAKNIKLMEWWKQVEKSASMHKNSPVLFIHQDGMGEREWLVVMNNEDWIAMAKGTETIEATYVDHNKAREDKYTIESAISGLKKALKVLEE